MRKTAKKSSHASRLFCLGILISLVLAATGCSNPAGSTGGGSTTTVTSVTASCTPNVLNPGQTSPCTQSVQGQDNPSQAVTWTVSPTTAGTITAAGAFTASSTITTVTTVTVTACSALQGYTSICGPATITVTPVVVAPPSPTISATLMTIVIGQSIGLSWNGGSTATSATVSGPGFTTSTALTGSNVTATPTAVGTSTYTITSTNAGGSNSASVTVTVNPANAVTGVSFPCTSTSFTNAQTTSCTPQVTGTGSYATTVNITLSPASAGTLSASSNVAAGTPVVFTPTFNTGAQTPTITACSTMTGFTGVCGSTKLTVTLRTITINSPTGNIWLADCAGIVLYSSTETGIVSGDALYVYLYAANTFTTTPVSTFTTGLPIGNNPSGLNPCSPGAYDEYVSGTDGARSNDQYIPILSPWNMWAGYNATDEFQVDFAANCIQPYKLTDGTKDGACLPNTAVTLAAVVDGNNILTSNLGNTGIGVYNITTGTAPVIVGSSDGSSVVDFAAKNGIAAYTTTEPEVGFSMESFYTANNLPNVGTAPSAIAGSTGCNANLNAASFFSYDNAGTTLYREDVVGNASSGTITSKSVVDQVTLSGFSPASALPANLARYAVAWDSSCKAAVLAPVTTGGTNPDGTTTYVMEFALLDMTSGSARQLGTYVSTGIPASAIRIAADPAGNDVVIASTNQAAGTTVFTKVSWTLDANENPTFTVTPLASAPPTGVYGVSLGILPPSVVPNGNVIRVGQRQQHYALPLQ